MVNCTFGLMEHKMDQYNGISSTSGIGGVMVIPEPGTTTPAVAVRDSSAGNVPSSSETKAKPSQRPPPALLELKHKKIQYYCGIPSCRTRTEKDKLTFASTNVLAYYGFKNRLEIIKVCPKCLEKAQVHQMKSMEAIRNNESIFKLKHEPQPAEMLNLDGDDSADEPDSSRRGEADDEIQVDFNIEDVVQQVHSALKKFNIQNQVEKCKEIAIAEANALESQFATLKSYMNVVDDRLYKTCKLFNQTFERKTNSVIVQEVEISPDGSIRKRNVAGENRRVFINSKSMAKLDSLIGPQKDEAAAEYANDRVCMNESVMSISDRRPGPASKTAYYECLEKEAALKGPFQRPIRKPPCFEKKKTTALLPTPAVIPRIKLKIGDLVYALNKCLLNHWLRAQVVEAVDNSDTKQLEFVIHYEPTRNGRPTGGKEDEGTVRYMRQVSMRELAYNVPCPFVLPVGTRIIAKFKDELQTDPESDGYYYAGIIAEVPKPVNNDRYLIFFDDGYSQYVSNEEVLLVCENSDQVWNDVYPDSYDFIKEYLIRYPNWPRIRLHVGDIVPVEWNSKWWSARVVEVDASLAKVLFESDGREEWIYRGSSRFRPVFYEFEKEERLKAVAESFIPRHNTDELKNRSLPPVEYTSYDETNTTKVRKSAMKSTGRFQYNAMFNDVTANTINMFDIDVGIEFQGTMTKVKIPDDAPKPKNYTPHECCSNCVIQFVPTKTLITQSPLAIPLFLGWERDLVKSPRHAIFYRTPCGLRLKNYDELSNFLEVTNSNMKMDHFSFDVKVDCLNKFVPSLSLVFIKDISNGKERVPVQGINSVDFETLPYMEYTPKRIPGEGVNLNTEDEDFLVCCDCTDNCKDKSKCACWQLTMEGVSFTKLNHPNFPTVGYENGRLNDHIISGIYECNSRCKCKETCTNRVVQSGVRWPLQIFKTTKKGWGIRTLYDMPEGSFICVYTGQVLTESTANEMGIENGDEYLAELDYIECMEGVKANYESDVTDIEDDSSSEDDAKKKRIGSSDEDSEPEKESHADDASFKTKAKARAVAKKRTGGGNMFEDEDIVTSRTPSHFNAQISQKKKRKRISIRELFDPEDEQSYIMDAKKKGNLGRYINHSCTPNVFNQNVFGDTHDLRFPLVAFFTNSFVKAGSELTWNYNYNIGSVPGKKLYCFCMTPYCRGRLL